MEAWTKEAHAHGLGDKGRGVTSLKVHVAELGQTPRALEALPLPSSLARSVGWVWSAETNLETMK